MTWQVRFDVEVDLDIKETEQAELSYFASAGESDE